MKTEIEKLITKYKTKISKLQELQKHYESISRGGMCISNQGEINAYNAVISDLKRLIE